MDTGVFKRLDLLFGLGHRAHKEHLRLKSDDLLDVGLIAGLHGGDLLHFGGVVAVGAAADEQVHAAERADDLAVGRRERNDARGRLFERDLAAGHVGHGDGGVLRGGFGGFHGGFGRLGGSFRRGGISALSAGGEREQHQGCQCKSKDLFGVHFLNSLSKNIQTTSLPAQKRRPSLGKGGGIGDGSHSYTPSQKLSCENRFPDLASSYSSPFPPFGSGTGFFVRFTVTGIVRNLHPCSLGGVSPGGVFRRGSARCLFVAILYRFPRRMSRRQNRRFRYFTKKRRFSSKF